MRNKVTVYTAAMYVIMVHGSHLCMPGMKCAGVHCSLITN